MHVLNVNFAIDLKEGGGTAERTFQMSRHLARLGVCCSVLTINFGFAEKASEGIFPAKLYTLKLFSRRFAIPYFNFRLIYKLCNRANIIHLMGHWSIINAYVYIVARLIGRPYIVCPAGALPLFGRSIVIKWLYNFFIGNAIIRNASGWIAVTEAEFPYFESYGIKSNLIHVIPNGVNEDSIQESDVSDILHKYNLPNAPIILFMGRLNPIKGPDLLLEAFSSLDHSYGAWHLVFAGPDEGMKDALLKMAGDMSVSHRVHFCGYIAGREKTAAYHMAKLLVVPSRQEAMSIVALEAAVCGTPVLLTDQCGFGEVREIDVAVEVPASVDGLARGLIYLLADPVRLERLGVEFKNLVSSRYKWNSLVNRYLDIFESITSMKKVKNNKSELRG